MRWPRVCRRVRSTAKTSVAREIMVLQALLVLTLLVVATTLAVLDARGDARDNATERSVGVALSVAGSPDVRDAVADPDPTERLQGYVEGVRNETGVDFVVVMSPQRIRFTHPDPQRIGESFVGDLGDAPQGGIFTQEYAGTLGPSMRAVVPVVDASSGVIALVSVGITLETINAQLGADTLTIALVALGLLGLGAIGAVGVGRRLRVATHGLGEREIARIYEYHEALLHAVREGLILVDPDDVVQLVNDEARRLLDLPADAVGRPLDDLGLSPALPATVRDARDESDAIYAAGDHLLVVTSSPARWRGREVGSVITLRDHTELQEVMGELDVVRGLTDSLHAQQHEASNRLHTMVSLIETGRSGEAVEFATGELRLTQLLTDRMVASAGDPVIGALLLAKLSEAAESGVFLDVVDTLTEDARIASRDLVTIVGNLIDNAFDAVAGEPAPHVRCELATTPQGLRISVADNGPGIGDRDLAQLLERGWTTKLAGHEESGGRRRGIGLALVAQAVRRHGGEIEAATSASGGADFVITLPVQRPAAAAR